MTYAQAVPLYSKQLIVLEKPAVLQVSLIITELLSYPVLYGDHTVMNKNVSGLSSTDSNPEALKLIAQRVVNRSLLATYPMRSIGS